MKDKMQSRFRWIVSFSMIVLVGCTSERQSTSSSGLPYADELSGAVFSPPRNLADFSLLSTTGDMFTLSEHKGEVILIYFGYRACPDFCPTTFSELRRIYQELDEPAEKLKIIFVTVDPERDQLEDLALYMSAFHSDFVGLRTEGEELQNLLNQFGVVAQKRQLAESELSYLIDHTASIFLIGPDGRLQVQYLYGTDYRDIVHDLRIILGSI